MNICIPNEILYADKDIQEMILSKFNGILFAGDRDGFKLYKANREALADSMSLNSDYFDEPYSTPTKDNQGFERFPDAVIGETFRNIFKVKGTPIALTTYSTFLIFSQLLKWKILNLFCGDRFQLCWISVDKNDGKYEKLIKWAEDHNKEVWIYVEYDISKEVLLKTIEAL